MIINTTPEIVLNHTCELGEGPVWNAVNESILWIDITRCEIHKYNNIEQKHSIFKLDQMVGCIALREGNGLIAALQHGFAFVDLDEQTVQLISDPENDKPDNRFNDGTCDVAGRFWAGTMALSQEEGKGSLYVMETDLTVKKKIDNVTLSNGIAFSPDNTIMYYINSPTKYIFAFDFNAAEGNITNQRVAIDLTHEDGTPDGMTIDEEGNLWIAFFGGWRIGKYNPETGELVHAINLPVANVSCCTFGGVSLSDLYITTVSDGMSDEDKRKQPLAGSLFVVKNCGSRGIPTFNFKG